MPDYVRKPLCACLSESASPALPIRLLIIITRHRRRLFCRAPSVVPLEAADGKAGPGTLRVTQPANRLVVQRRGSFGQAAAARSPSPVLLRW